MHHLVNTRLSEETEKKEKRIDCFFCKTKLFGPIIKIKISIIFKDCQN